MAIQPHTNKTNSHVTPLSDGDTLILQNFREHDPMAIESVRDADEIAVDQLLGGRETERSRPEPPSHGPRSADPFQPAGRPIPAEDTRVREDREPARRGPRRRQRRNRTVLPNAGNPWVSKTQFLLYLRCPYAFFQIDAGYLAPDVMVDELGERLIKEGIDFEQTVTSTTTPLPPEVDLDQALTGERPFYGLPVLRNQKLKILGVPDGIDPAGGALVPIEIKSHKDVKPTDLWELAFYWMLLEPYRPRDQRIAQPRGRLILRRDGLPVEVPVDLKPEHFSRVRVTLALIRRARYYGVKPRVCNCPACSGPLREQIAEATRANKDLSMIWGIGRKYAPALEAVGLSNYDALADCHPGLVVEGLRERGCNNVSVGMVEMWRRHARAYDQAAPVVFGPAPPVADRFIALDLEYDDDPGHMWLIGVLIDKGPEHERERVFLWADTTEDEKRNLCALAELVRVHQGLRVITWNGDGADVPRLRKRAVHHELGDTLDPVLSRHVDLYAYARESFRLPIPMLKLESVASYFGILKTSTIKDGLHAKWLFDAYLTSRDPREREDIRRKLLDYNRDDLDMLAAVLEAIQRLIGAETITQTLIPESQF
jgi:predicted RecB family nuclease